MQYLLLIYENKKRFNQGYPEGEMAEHLSFGKEFAGAIKGGHALQPTRFWILDNFGFWIEEPSILDFG